MDGFELNKTFAAVLIALLFGMASTKVADVLISPEMLTEDAFKVEGMQSASAGAAPAQEAELPPIQPLLASADIGAGQKVFNKCTQCHTITAGGKNLIGPNLFKIVNANVGKKSGFGYSKTMASMGGVWDVESLNKFLHKPRKYVKGTKMSFAGLKKEKDRANVIAYLQANS